MVLKIRYPTKEKKNFLLHKTKNNLDGNKRRTSKVSNIKILVMIKITEIMSNF